MPFNTIWCKLQKCYYNSLGKLKNVIVSWKLGLLPRESLAAKKQHKNQNAQSIYSQQMSCVFYVVSFTLISWRYFAAIFSLSFYFLPGFKSWSPFPCRQFSIKSIWPIYQKETMFTVATEIWNSLFRVSYPIVRTGLCLVVSLCSQWDNNGQFPNRTQGS